MHVDNILMLFEAANGNPLTMKELNIEKRKVMLRYTESEWSNLTHAEADNIATDIYLAVLNTAWFSGDFEYVG